MEELADDKAKPRKRSHNEVWIALIGAVASIAVAATTAVYRARPAAASALDQRVSEIDALREEIDALRNDVASIKASAGILRQLPVGAIIASMLSPNLMQEQGGGQWVAADGRNCLPDWQYTRLTGEPRVPDMRGMFLRGVNDSDRGVRTAKDGGDPDGVREPGHTQDHAIAGHGHDLYLKAALFGHSGSSNWASNIFNEGNLGTRVTGSVRAEENAPTETRPKNVAVRWYIKVN